MADTLVYRIRDWLEVFENAETLRTKSLARVPTPTRHDGLGFRRMVAQEDGAQLFGCWNAMVQIASRAKTPETRGYLVRDGQPLAAEDLALMIGFHAALFQRALEFFSDPKQGWLEQAPLEQYLDLLGIKGVPGARSVGTRIDDHEGASGDAAAVRTAVLGESTDGPGNPTRSPRAHPGTSGPLPEATGNHPGTPTGGDGPGHRSDRLILTKSDQDQSIDSPRAREAFDRLLPEVLGFTQEPDTPQARAHWQHFFLELGAEGLRSCVSACVDAARRGPIGRRGGYLTKACRTAVESRKRGAA